MPRSSPSRVSAAVSKREYPDSRASFSVSKLSAVPKSSDNNDLEESLTIPSEDSDNGEDLWAPDGSFREELRGTVEFPNFKEDDQLCHVCVGVDIGTAVHEVSFLLFAPTHPDANTSKKDQSSATSVDKFVTTKFGFHMHAALCVENTSGGGASKDNVAESEASDDDHMDLTSLGSTRSRLVQLNKTSGPDLLHASGSNVPHGLYLLPFNKRALLESIRTEFPDQDPVRLWMASYCHHKPTAAFARACEELSRVTTDYLVRYAPDVLLSKSTNAWARLFDEGYTCDAICYTLPYSFSRVHGATEILAAVDASFAERAKHKHSLFVVTHIFDHYASIVYYAVNLKRSRKVLGKQRLSDTGYLIDIGHGFTSCAAFSLHRPKKKPRKIEILSESGVDVGYIDVIHAVMELVVQRFESIFQTPPKIWQYLAMFEVCRSELKAWAAELTQQIRAFSRRHRRGAEETGSPDLRKGKRSPRMATKRAEAFWSSPDAWRKSARRNLNYHLSSSRLIRFKSAWADFSLNITGKKFFEVARPAFKRMLGVCSRTFRRAAFNSSTSAPAILFSSDTYAEVPVFHELLNLKLKKIFKAHVKQNKRHGKHSAMRLEKICLGQSSVAQGGAICAALMKDMHLDTLFDKRAKKEAPFTRIVGSNHHLHRWGSAVLKLVQKTKTYLAQSDEDKTAKAEASRREEMEYDAMSPMFSPMRSAQASPAKRTSQIRSPAASPFGTHKLHVGQASRGPLARSKTSKDPTISKALFETARSQSLPGTSATLPSQNVISGYDMDVQVSDRLLERQNKSQIQDGELRLLCITWNLGNAPPNPSQVSELLSDLDNVDLLVFAGQEAVWSSGAGKPKKQKNHDDDEEEEGAEMVEEPDSEDELDLDMDFVESSEDNVDDPFAQIISKRAALLGFQTIRAVSMGEIRLLVMGRKQFVTANRVSEMQAVCVPTGVAGVGTNKGGVVVKMCFDETSLVFVSSHLAAHLKNVAARNQNFRQILKAATLGNMDLDFDCQFHHVIWLGDLNYRVNLRALEGLPPPSKGAQHEAHWARVRKLVRDRQWSKLIQADQLQLCQNEGKCFVGFTEGHYNFSPTFKMKRSPGFEYTTQRVPSYCDRILWRSLPAPRPTDEVICEDHIRLLKLEAFPQASTSDHKPVRAVLAAQLFEKVDYSTVPGLIGSEVQATSASSPHKRRSTTRPRGSFMSRSDSGASFADAAIRTAVVRFSRLQAKGLKAADINGKSDPYLRFHSVPHRDYLAKSTYSSKKKKATLNPQWNNSDVPEIVTVLQNNEQLKKLVIVISLWDHDVSSADDPLGHVIVPIGNFLPSDADGEECSDVPPRKFNKRITLHGQQSSDQGDLGYIRGMVSITWQWDAGIGGDDKRNSCSVQ